MLSSNNYLGLAGHPEVIRAAQEALDRYGAGTASVRFICGTEPHHELERELARLVGTEGALTYASCWNANEAVIPTLTDERTVLISDALNHASIVDAMRLAKPARKVVYGHSDMGELRDALAGCEARQRKLVVTDGVFSMEGDLARLPDIVELARAHDAIVLVDDSHGTGVMGELGRGVAEHFGLLGEIDVITSTLGKALGGAGLRRLQCRGRGRARSALAPAALLERDPAVGRLRRAAGRAAPARAAGARERCTRTQSASRPTAGGGLQPARRRGGDHPNHHRRDRRRNRLPERLLEEGVFVQASASRSCPKDGAGSRPDDGSRDGRASRPRSCRLRVRGAERRSYNSTRSALKSGNGAAARSAPGRSGVLRLVDEPETGNSSAAESTLASVSAT